jgi:hypothetical protein
VVLLKAGEAHSFEQALSIIRKVLAIISMSLGSLFTKAGNDPIQYHHSGGVIRFRHGDCSIFVNHEKFDQYARGRERPYQ